MRCRNRFPPRERIVTIEDAAELRLAQPHVLSLEARPPNVEGRGEITIRDLVRNALRMRPDRIIVGECRGGEALDMLQAMNTGHDGSMTTGHANSPRDLLSRLEVMVLMAGMDLPVRAIREQIASAVDIIVQQTRFSDGRRRVTSIVEVDGMEGDVILTQPLFAFKQRGVGAAGEVIGDYIGLGQAPHFYEDLEEAGIALDRASSQYGCAESLIGSLSTRCVAQTVTDMERLFALIDSRLAIVAATVLSVSLLLLLARRGSGAIENAFIVERQRRAQAELHHRESASPVCRSACC